MQVLRISWNFYHSDATAKKAIRGVILNYGAQQWAVSINQWAVYIL